MQAPELWDKAREIQEKWATCDVQDLPGYRQPGASL